MTTIFPTPIKFYQIRSNDESLTLSDIGKKFDVPLENIERDNPNKDEPLLAGEMLVIRYS